MSDRDTANALRFGLKTFLKPWTKKLGPAEALFRQGENGDTLIVVLEGRVFLTANWDGREVIVDVIDEGQVLGERSLLNDEPHSRFFGARSDGPVLYAEFRRDQFDVMEKQNAQMCLALLRMTLRNAVDRLMRSDHLVRVLKSTDIVERLVYLILHFAEFRGRQGETGTEIYLPVPTLRYYLGTVPAKVKNVLAELEKRQILVRVSEDDFLLTNQLSLVNAVKDLRSL